MKVHKAKQILDKVYAEKNRIKYRKQYEIIDIIRNILEDFVNDITALPYSHYVELTVEKPVTNPLVKLFKKTETKTLTIVYPSYDHLGEEIIGLKYSSSSGAYGLSFCALSREEDVAEFVMYVSDKLAA